MAISVTSTGSQAKIAQGSFENVVNYIMLGSIQPIEIKSVGWDLALGSVSVLYFQ